MTDYINGALMEGIEKARMLKAKIPRTRDLGVYFSPLATSANSEIDSIIQEFNHLYNNVDYSKPDSLRQKFYQFKQVSTRLSEVENVVIAAISRKAEDDEFINKLVYEICSEINYPLPAPVASCLSQKYYHIYPSYNLICIPLLESDFLLHLADVYHELGHPLNALDNPKLDGFKRNRGRFNIEVKKYFNDEIKRRQLNKFNPAMFDSLHVWRDSWVEKWSEELFCDLFATYTLGPAYAWSNIHMCTKMSWSFYKIPMFQKSTHPPDEARMRAILSALQLMGFKTEAEKIALKWEEFKAIVGERNSTDFSIAVPDYLIQQIVAFSWIATKEIDCEIVSPQHQTKIYSILNSAWDEFWKNPSTFRNWESENIKQLKCYLTK